MDYHSDIFLPAFQILSITPAATTVLIVAAVLLLLISFLIAGSEIAFFSMTSKDLNVLKTKRQPAFRRIVYLMEHPKILMTSMVLAGSFVNLGIILISNILLDGILENLTLSFWSVFFIKVAILTIILVLFSQVLPKVWATHHKVWFAATASLMIEIFNSLLFRMSNRLVRFTERMEKRTGPRAATMIRSDIDDAIDLLPEHEANHEEKQILKGIRKFGDTTVKQIMRTRLDVSGIETDCTFNEVKKIVLELNYSRLPVYKHNLDEIKGMLHTKDLLPYIGEPDTFDWTTLMRQPYFVHEQKLIEDLLQEFRTRRIHFAVVVDEFGGTSGIVTLEDIMEEIIGEIEDEFDDEESGNIRIDDYNYIFEGKTMIHDVCRMMKLPSDVFESVRGDSDSLAGLVLEIAGEFPQVNEQLVSGDFTFVPLEINKNRIDKVKITVAPPVPA